MLFSPKALESRGISELLLTSDSHEGLKNGGVGRGKALIRQLKQADIPESISSPAYESRLTDFTFVSVLRTLNLRKLNYEDIKYLESVQVIGLF